MAVSGRFNYWHGGRPVRLITFSIPLAATATVGGLEVQSALGTASGAAGGTGVAAGLGVSSGLGAVAGYGEHHIDAVAIAAGVGVTSGLGDVAGYGEEHIDGVAVADGLEVQSALGAVYAGGDVHIDATAIVAGVGVLSGLGVVAATGEGGGGEEEPAPWPAIPDYLTWGWDELPYTIPFPPLLVHARARVRGLGVTSAVGKVSAHADGRAGAIGVGADLTLENLRAHGVQNLSDEALLLFLLAA